MWGAGMGFLPLPQFRETYAIALSYQIFDGEIKFLKALAHLENTSFSNSYLHIFPFIQYCQMIGLKLEKLVFIWFFGQNQFIFAQLNIFSSADHK